MQKKISNLPFKGTPEQEKQLKAVIDANKHDSSHLMAVMQEAQGIYGYLPMEVQSMIAEGMDVPLEKVYGVATISFLLDGGDGLSLAENALSVQQYDEVPIIDAVLEHMAAEAAAGRPIEYRTDGRVVVKDYKRKK